MLEAFLVPQGENMSSQQSYISENSLGAIAYVAIIPAILLLLIPRYKKNPYVRFHAWQAIEIALTAIVITYGLMFTVVRGPLCMGLTWLALMGLSLTCWFCGVMALRGKTIRLPMIGGWAEGLMNHTLLPARAVARSFVSERSGEFMQ